MIREVLKKNKVIYKIGKFINKKLYEKEQNKQRILMHKYGYEACDQVSKALKDVKHFVFFGTLLGFIRDKGFIEHDCDIDFCIQEKNLNIQLLNDKLVEFGFQFIRAFKLKNGTPLECTYRYKGLNVDFFILEENKTINSYSSYRFSEIKYSSNLEYNIKKIEYKKIDEIIKYKVKGIEVNIPKNYVEILEFVYGKTWNKLDKNWDGSISPAVILSEKSYLTYNVKEFLNNKLDSLSN